MIGTITLDHKVFDVGAITSEEAIGTLTLVHVLTGITSIVSAEAVGTPTLVHVFVGVGDIPSAQYVPPDGKIYLVITAVGAIPTAEAFETDATVTKV